MSIKSHEFLALIEYILASYDVNSIEVICYNSIIKLSSDVKNKYSIESGGINDE